MNIWLSDNKTGIKCGINDNGELFIGDDQSGENLPDTPDNREKIINTFCKYTGEPRLDFEPSDINISTVE